MSAIGQTGTVPAAPSGEANGVPPGPGQAPTSPPDQGQQQTPQGFWGRFPNVPEDQRAALEPHLKQVQGYVTRLEQNYVAPFRGYTPQQVQGLAQFAKAFDSDPVQVFLGIADQLQKSGVIHEDLDLEALAAVVQGQEPPGDEEEHPPGQVPVDDGTGDPWENAPAWAQQMRAWQQKQEQQQQETQRTTRERQENAVLEHAVKGVQAKLKAAGYPEGSVTKEDIQAAFIVHKGNIEGVLGSFAKLRTGLLQGVVNKDNDTVDLPHGVPPDGRTATQRKAKADPRDPFKAASASAEQMLRSSLKQAQQ